MQEDTYFSTVMAILGDVFRPNQILKDLRLQ